MSVNILLYKNVHVLLDLEIKILKYHGYRLRTFKVTVCVLISKGYKHNVKAEDFINALCPYKRQISMLRLIALRGVRAHENVKHLQRRVNVM